MSVQLEWTKGDLTVSWNHSGGEVVKTYLEPPRSAVYLDDPPSVVVVEAMPGSPGPSNAVVYEVDGTERVRLIPPDVPEPIGFDQVFRSRAGVEAVFASRKIDVHGDPNLLDGTLRNVREWR